MVGRFARIVPLDGSLATEGKYYKIAMGLGAFGHGRFAIGTDPISRSYSPVAMNIPRDLCLSPDPPQQTAFNGQ